MSCPVCAVGHVLLCVCFVDVVVEKCPGFNDFNPVRRDRITVDLGSWTFFFTCLVATSAAAQDWYNLVGNSLILTMVSRAAA